MKLFTRYNRANITATILAFVIGSAAFYFVLDYVLTRQLDQTLRIEQQEITAYVNQHDTLPVIENARDQWIDIQPVHQNWGHDSFRTITTFNKQENENEPIRQLRFSVRVKSQWYLVMVNKSATETEDLIKMIIGIAICMIALVLLFNYIINRTVIRRLWQPFYHTIDRIRNYRLNTELALPDERIDEIALLNQSLNQMADQINQDYQTLRSFAENASHEMQTPLSVIRTKVEILMQSAEGHETMMRHLLVVEDATQKLARLHQSLLLLTKLKNRQFQASEAVDFYQLITRKLEERKELFDARTLHITLAGTHSLAYFHPQLADIVINNLFTNALRYTPAGGDVDIEITQEFLSFKNTAVAGSLNTSKIFQRFYKEDGNSEGTGLGLSIMDEVCTASGAKIVYRFAHNKHDFTIYFKILE